jgi:hypothetical protein
MENDALFNIPLDSNLHYPVFSQGAELHLVPSYGSEEYPVFTAQSLAATDASLHSPSNYMTLDPGIEWEDAGSSPSDISFLLPRQKRTIARSHSDEGETDDDIQFSSVEFAFDPSPASIADYLSRSANHTMMTESLMKIYHDSMENALSCWLNERTCPYRYKPGPKAIENGSATLPDQDVKMAWAPDWPNRIFRRVFNLDRVAGKIRDKPLSHEEDNKASKALYLVIMAFASQWAQASQRSREEHPPLSGLPNPFGTRIPAGKTVEEFDRVLQQAYWQAARKALVECSDIESFKVAFASIVFSLTQKPITAEHQEAIRRESFSSQSVDLGMGMDFDVLQDQVNKVIDEDGPPIFLEQGVRHVHSLRHKLQRRERELSKLYGVDPKRTILRTEDRTTVELMAWLGYMLESLTSAMHQRPLVVSDEDCDVLPEAIEALNLNDSDIPPPKREGSRLWNDFFFLQDLSNRRGEVLRYPCSYEAAAAGLTDAAPIKVLLYRKVTLLQSLFNRGGSVAKIEDTINDGMKVYEYWQHRYEGFFKGCVQHHDTLHPRIQSWYICLSGHWLLATLLFADVIESVDESELSSESGRRVRRIGNLVGTLRRHNSPLVSDLASCATPRADSSFANSKSFHFALNAGALLTEPWTAILIRVFSKSAVLLMREACAAAEEERSAAARGIQTNLLSVQNLAKRCEDCIRALKYLGRKSDTARLAGDTLADALHQRQILLHGTTSGVGPAAMGIQTSWGEQELGMAASGQSGWLAQGDSALDECPLFGDEADGFGLESWVGVP